MTHTERDQLREALRQNSEGWKNVVEMGLLPPQHHATARNLADQCDDALAALASKPALDPATVEHCAKIAEIYSSIHVEKRDDTLAVMNMSGALTLARQAQTCDEIAAAIRASVEQQAQ